MRYALNNIILRVLLTAGLVFWVQGCGRDSKFDWRKGTNLLPSDVMSGGFKKIHEDLKTAASAGAPIPSVSIFTPNCHANELIGRGQTPLFLTLSVIDLIDNYTEAEIEDMTLVIQRDVNGISQNNQKGVVKLYYMLPLQLYFLVQDVVGPERMESEEVKKIFYIFGIPFLPETYAALTSQGRLLSLDPEKYAENWLNARRFFEPVKEWDIYRRLMDDILPPAELRSWLEARGFFKDEIDFLLKLIILDPKQAPASQALTTTYVSFECQYTLAGLPWFEPTFGEQPWSWGEKKPDEIRDRYFELTKDFQIMWWGYYCPTPSPSPSPSPLIRIGDWAKVPCPSPADGTGKGGGDVAVSASPSPTPPTTGDGHGAVCSNPPTTGATLVNDLPAVLVSMGWNSLPFPINLTASSLPGYHTTYSPSLPASTFLTSDSQVLDAAAGSPLDGRPGSGSGNYALYFNINSVWKIMYIHCGQLYYAP